MELGKALRVNNGTDPTADLGPVISKEVKTCIQNFLKDFCDHKGRSWLVIFVLCYLWFSVEVKIHFYCWILQVFVYACKNVGLWLLVNFSFIIILDVFSDFSGKESYMQISSECC